MTGPDILIVDDDPLAREIAVEALSAAGYACRTAEDGQAGIEAMAVRTADLVILDMIMPRKDGVEAYAQIRANWPAARIIVVTAGGSTADADFLLRMARGLGADAVMRKPVRPAALTELVGQVMKAAAA